MTLAISGASRRGRALGDPRCILQNSFIVHFRKEYGVSLRDLVPVAEPAQKSRCVVIQLEKGERFGWCFHRDHDGAWELEHPSPNFDAALKALIDGIAQHDTAMLSFLGVYLD
jgi:hypothetical protein